MANLDKIQVISIVSDRTASSNDAGKKRGDNAAGNSPAISNFPIISPNNLFMLGVKPTENIQIMHSKEKIILIKGSAQLTFTFEENNMVKSQEDYEKLKKIFEMVEKVNGWLSINKVRQIHVIKDPDGAKFNIPPKGEVFIDLPINAPYYLQDLTHEMGHLYFEEKLANPVNHLATIDMDLHDIAQFSLPFCDIVDDSNYEGRSSIVGHPQDNDTELFASSFMVYTTYGDRFLAKIMDPTNSPERTKAGKMIFKYMKDKVFGGKIFCDKEAYEKSGISDYTYSVTQKEILKNTFTALKIDCLFAGAVQRIRDIGPREDVIALMINASRDTDPKARMGVMFAESKLYWHSPKIVQMLFDGAADKDPGVRAAAILAISEMEFELLVTDEEIYADTFMSDKPPQNVIELNNKIKTLLINAAHDKDRDVRGWAIYALGGLRVKDEQVVQTVLGSLKDKKDSDMRKCAINSIIRMNMKRTEFIQPLIDALNDENEEVRDTARTAIKERGIDIVTKCYKK